MQSIYSDLQKRIKIKFGQKGGMTNKSPLEVSARAGSLAPVVD